MTQEDKELLLRDICARLPYGVHISVHDTFEYSTVPYEKVYIKSSDISYLIDSISLNERYNSKDKRFNRIIKERKDFLEFTPYLIPLSSMTEEQKKYISDRWGINENFDFEIDPNWGKYFVDLGDAVGFINWCYENHFDINGLIPKGLAIDATDKDILLKNGGLIYDTGK